MAHHRQLKSTYKHSSFAAQRVNEPPKNGLASSSPSRVLKILLPVENGPTSSSDSHICCIRYLPKGDSALRAAWLAAGRAQAALRLGTFHISFTAVQNK